MDVQPLVKLPFKLGRAVVRAVVGSGDRGHLVRATPQPRPTPVEAEPPAPPRGPIGVRVEETPNPDARKFTCSITVVPEGSLVANGPDQAQGVPFVKALFALDGVRTVFATRDFVTVTRQPEGPTWRELQPVVEATLRQTVGL